ncbi:ribosomal protein S12 methylthiotransferase accessory factor [Spinactinospora alkalitolerans]|uniref:Ribosomal protein S12 methylthiotransferase accessory factor n=1 Tax=Spinactinospora alkalitolerans TaxID=687207 RepID=A0A852U657_9ACTN|nr:YcaO-like family protein [Spinactinospora alkalitolerans]NYE50353.1 ribosomal protein S12 methylthiotransferase accessory factor [Spinactinospora alkalitolerans]
MVGGEGAGPLPLPPAPGNAAWSGARERELPLAEAERRVHAEIRALGWRSRYRVLDEDEPTATQCELWHSDGTEVPYGLGSGKGLSAPARVGAQFEALEHALSGPLVFDSLPVRLCDAADLLSGPFGADRAVRDAARQPGARLACLRHSALDGGPDFDVPLFLWAPWYPVPTPGMLERRSRLGDTADYRSMLSYSVNTGCAIGATDDEALLHALNEWAERDAFSLFLLCGVYDRGPMPARIPREALPGFLRERLDRAAAVVGGPVVLLDLTTDLGVPVVMAYAPALAGSSARYYGLGASLSGETAVERAVTEFVQGELLAGVVAEHAAAPRERPARRPAERPTFDQVVAEHDIAAAVRERLAGHPRLLACAHLDFADRLADAPVAGVPPETVPPGTPVARQRAAVVERIAAAGHRVAAHRLAVLEHGTTVVQVQCPGLERFHLITKGHLALPGERGRRLRARDRV